MSLKLLVVEDEPELEISHVPLSESEAVEPDMELPNDFTVQDDLDLLQDAATALEAIGCQAACEGMDIAAARELDKLVPGFMRRNGGHSAFTSRPSLEGLSDTVKTVKDKFVEIIQALRKRVAQMYASFKAWLMAKFSKPEAQQPKEEVNDFLNKTPERNAIGFIASLPETPEEAAEEVARLMDGDTKAFTASLTDSFKSLNKRMRSLEESIESNPTHYRLALGLSTVEQIYNEDLDSGLRSIIEKAFKAAEAAMKARNKFHFSDAMEDIDTVSKEIDEFKESTISTGDSDGGAKIVPFDKLYDNVSKASEDMKKFSTQDKVVGASAAIDHIVKISTETALEDVLKAIPEDVPAEEHHKFAQKIATLYRQIAKLGSSMLLLWRARFNAVSSINEVGSALLGLKQGFETAVVGCGGSLTPEQKTQLTKALVGKGLNIAF